MNADPKADDLPRRQDYRFFTPIPTRWSDNDMFGHLNNVSYVRFFEATVVAFYLQQARLDVMAAPVVPFAAETLCRYRKPLSFPDTIEAALAVSHLGTSSVRFEIALFAPGEDTASCHGHWVHVFVDKLDQRPAPIPSAVRAAFESIRVVPE